MTSKVSAQGKRFVTTEPGDAVATLAAIDRVVLSNGEPAQVKRAFATAASNDTTELIPAVSDKLLRVVSLVMLQGATAGSVTLKSASTAISPVFTQAANGGMVLPFNPHGWFQTNAINEAFNVTVSNSSDCGIIVLFIEIPDDAYNLL